MSDLFGIDAIYLNESELPTANELPLILIHSAL